jgi:hypothetical protein
MSIYLRDSTLGSGIQIVPGISFPIGVGPANRGEEGFLLYLSIEHPYRRLRTQSN